MWLLPEATDVKSRAARKKREFLETVLDAKGYANYYRIINFDEREGGRSGCRGYLVSLARRINLYLEVAQPARSFSS